MEDTEEGDQKRTMGGGEDDSDKIIVCARPPGHLYGYGYYG